MSNGENFEQMGFLGEDGGIIRPESAPSWVVHYATARDVILVNSRDFRIYNPKFSYIYPTQHGAAVQVSTAETKALYEAGFVERLVFNDPRLNVFFVEDVPLEANVSGNIALPKGLWPK